MLGAIVPGNGSPGGYRTYRSLRFNDDDAPSLGRTPGVVPTNARQLTINVDIKRANLSTGGGVIREGATGNSTSDLLFFINAGDTDRLTLWLANGTYAITTARRFRDPSAFFNVHAVIDTPNAVAADRLQIWIDGQRETILDTAAYPPQNYDMVYFNANGVQQYIGRHWTALHFDGLMAEYHEVVGQALPPTAFGGVNADTGEWERKLYTGTYGNSGSQLKFEDNSNTTATTLGKDTSGNGNNWTPTNFSVAAGAGNDSLTDTPTSFDDGVVHGNFCTLASNNKHPHANASLSNAGLSFTGLTATFHFYALGTHAIYAGEKKAFEITAGADPSYLHFSGIGVVSALFAGPWAADEASTSAQIFTYVMDGTKRNNATPAAFGAAYTTADKVMCYVDATDIDNVKVWFEKNGAIQGGGDPVAGTSPAFSGIKGPVLPVVTAVSNAAAGGHHANFGQRPFGSTLRSGYSPICVASKPLPAEQNPRKKVTVSDRAGTGSAGSKSGLLFQPDALLVKPRVGGTGNANPITTAARGVGKYKPMNGAVAEVTDAQAITAFNSGGYSFGTAAALNAAATQFLDIALKSDPANGIEVITWVGDGAATKAIPHNLGKKPTFLMAAGMGATSWHLWHRFFGSDTHFQTCGASFVPDAANANSPLSAISASAVTVTNNATNNLNANGVVYVAIVFTDGPLFASGTYTGNANADGPVLTANFRPAFVAVYNANNQYWYAVDRARPANYNGNPSQECNYMFLGYGANVTTTTMLDFLSTGAKLRNSGVNFNQSGSTKYWFALAEAAGQYARAA